MHEELKQKIRDVLAGWGDKPLKAEDVIKALDLPPTDRKRIRRMMREMASDGEVAKLRNQRFTLPQHSNEIVGVLRTSTKGFGFVVPVAESTEQRDIFIPRKRMGDALEKDKVIVRIVGETPRNPEGEIVAVLERGTREVVGTFYNTKRGGNVIPRDERFNRSVITPRPDPALHIEDGAYVVAEINEWTPATQPLLGRVRELLGGPDTPGIDITMIIRDAGVDTEFPDDVIREAQAFPGKIPDAEIQRRADLRSLVTFTMDGPTAKDFDDALSIEPLEDGMVRLGVHIADVSQYVREGSPLDLEAYERATSIYPIDRVVPMLPENLSNNLCSLRPREDRLTMTCFMTIDERGRVHDYSIHESVIRSRHRLIYEEVQALMDGSADPSLVREIGDVRSELEQLYALRKTLTAMRLRRGALDLDVPEVEVQFDPDGAVSGVVRRARLESHRVVEECMLIANEVVASHLFNLHIPSLYRVHEDPDMQKLRDLQPVLANLGIRFPSRKDITPDAIQIALDKAAEMEGGFIARRLILRAMMRAHYHDENLGHYGLASACYTHFTSPIRRYPDLLVHRLLRETMVGGAPTAGRYSPPVLAATAGAMVQVVDSLPPRATPPLPEKRMNQLRSFLPTWTRHCSERERNAEYIENDATRAKTLEYMRQFLGEEFEGLVVSVLNWGVYVELVDMPVEGLIHVRNLSQDFFEYDEERMMLVGKHTGLTFRLADRVRVAVEAVNLATLEMDFGFVEKFMRPGAPAEISARHALRGARQERHQQRRPRTGGFQARGRRRKR